MCYQQLTADCSLPVSPIVPAFIAYLMAAGPSAASLRFSPSRRRLRRSVTSASSPSSVTEQASPFLEFSARTSPLRHRVRYEKRATFRRYFQELDREPTGENFSESSGYPLWRLVWRSSWCAPSRTFYCIDLLESGGQKHRRALGPEGDLVVIRIGLRIVISNSRSRPGAAINLCQSALLGPRILGLHAASQREARSPDK